MAPSRGQDGYLVRDTQTQPAKSRSKPKQKPKAKESKPSSAGKNQNSLKDGISNDVPRADMSRKAAIDLQIQQSLLDVFIASFPHLLGPNVISQTLQPLLQQLKQHLYDRDFKAAFGSQAFLEAYAVRWSASRALGYLGIFREVFPQLNARSRNYTTPSDSQISTITCLGGGLGAELVALAGLIELTPDIGALHLVSFDSAPSSELLTSMRENMAFLPSTIISEVRQLDLLAPSSAHTIHEAIARSDLTTLMFTLNELYTTSLSRTQTLLLDITSHSRAGSMLLIVDSPGSYSTVSLNGTEKKYPMAWLLDHVLLTLARKLDMKSGSRVAKKAEDINGTSTMVSRERTVVDDQGLESGPWKKVESVPSRWFRLPIQESHQLLRYPIELENMRYQMHLYERL